MKRLLSAAVFAALLGISSPATAGETTGVYVAPKVMWSHQVSGSSNIETDVSTAMAPASGVEKSSSSNTAGAGIAVGYDFSPQYDVPVRAEIEVSTRTQGKIDNSGLADDGAGTTYPVSHSRKFNTSTVFANFYYDIDTGTEFTPYVGVGVGVASISVKDAYSLDLTGPGWGTGVGSNKQTVTNFAWNLSAGVACRLDENWKLDLGYRYLNFGQVKGTAIPLTGAAQDYNARSKNDLTAHEVQMGLRYTF